MQLYSNTFGELDTEADFADGWLLWDYEVACFKNESFANSNARFNFGFCPTWSEFEISDTLKDFRDYECK